MEDKKYGLPRVDHLREAPAAVKFLSIEPFLRISDEFDISGIDWAIVGGESGHGARRWSKLGGNDPESLPRRKSPSSSSNGAGFISPRPAGHSTAEPMTKCPRNLRRQYPKENRVLSLLVRGRIERSTGCHHLTS